MSSHSASFNETICALLQAKAAFSKALYASVTEQYNVLKSAIHGNQGLDASSSIVSLSQQWKNNHRSVNSL